ncbi:unnamed protein product [Soboliphyme baturini]|uniref:CASP-like protein n=1 Tax=Soboliphyme baturini TaxID=241478 RepID=A0A183J424_9BILA|nr:unnamed protein product [Soboliphyme baturini]
MSVARCASVHCRFCAATAAAGACWIASLVVKHDRYLRRVPPHLLPRHRVMLSSSSSSKLGTHPFFALGPVAAPVPAVVTKPPPPPPQPDKKCHMSPPIDVVAVSGVVFVVAAVLDSVLHGGRVRVQRVPAQSRQQPYMRLLPPRLGATRYVCGLLELVLFSLIALAAIRLGGGPLQLEGGVCGGVRYFRKQLLLRYFVQNDTWLPIARCRVLSSLVTAVGSH